MIYGKRVIEAQPWLAKKGAFKTARLIDPPFQWKYTIYLTSAIVGAALVFLGPAFYYVHQNYDLFIDLADKTSPALYELLQRETVWLMIYLVASGAAICGLCLFLGLRLTEKIVGPLIAMERHMKKVTRGDLSGKEFRTRTEDDFKSLVTTYSYLVKSFRAQAQQDLQWLEFIEVDQEDREAVEALRALLQTKKAQLGIRDLSLTGKTVTDSANDSGAPTGAAPGTRRAS